MAMNIDTGETFTREEFEGFDNSERTKLVRIDHLDQKQVDDLKGMNRVQRRKWLRENKKGKWSKSE